MSSRGKDSMPRSFRRLRNITYGTTFSQRLTKQIADAELQRMAAKKKMKKTGWFKDPEIKLPAIHVSTGAQ